MEEHLCGGCGFIFDDSQGYPEVEVAAETKFADLPRDWVCPLCGAGKDLFIEVE
ncbi:MAG: Rubredoxin [Desulfobacca sp. RBG_16_60_12]|nr:MAG: Rubredoxin [Desulfobacca sp. RBG_16_60_12]